MQEKLQTNLCVLKRSRKKPQAGDIFTFQLQQLPEVYFYGRVVKTDTKIGNIDNVILVYIYKKTSSDKLQIPDLCLEDLMIPPKGINALPWAKAYFETISNRPIAHKDTYPIHCFKFVDPLSGIKYFDEYGNKLTECLEPCGDWGMGGYLTIDYAASKFANFLNP